MNLEERTDAVLARLGTVANLDVFLGEPAARMDSDNRAHPYAALYPTPGRSDPDQGSVDGSADLMTWTFQVTAAGGDVDRATRAATRVLGVLVGYRLEATADPIRLEFEPAPVTVDRDVTPARYYYPLMFTAPLANTAV